MSVHSGADRVKQVNYLKHSQQGFSITEEGKSTSFSVSEVTAASCNGIVFWLHFKNQIENDLERSNALQNRLAGRECERNRQVVIPT